jgi:hypothetical protein
MAMQLSIWWQQVHARPAFKILKAQHPNQQLDSAD